jgi:hypothetical protein
MTADDVRALIAYLEAHVRLEAGGGRAIAFDRPDEEAMLAAGIHRDAVKQVLAAPWLDEMVVDVRETPEFCEPDDPPEQVLRCARDVVGEYVRKRFQLPADG